MADINIQKKKSNPWPWIIIIILILALTGYFIWQAMDDPETDNTETVNAEPTGDADDEGTEGQSGTMMLPAVDSFLAFADRQGSTPEMGLDHNYTAKGLNLMADAIEAIANKKNLQADLSDSVQNLRTAAGAIQKDPESLKHADKIRKATMAGAGAMQKLQERGYPDMQTQTDAVMQAAKDIKPGTQTLDQKQKVKDYFHTAASEMREMYGK